MIAVAYLIYGILLFPLSLIPLPLLYLFSDILRFILFDLIGYRKKVIRTNLRNAFPEKSERELRSIEFKFQRNFCDIFFAETIKNLSPFGWHINKMITFRNQEVMKDQFDKKRNVILVCGHYGNWELMAHLSRGDLFRHHVLAIYKVQSVIADTILKIARRRSGVELVPMDSVKYFFEHPNAKPQSIIFIGDQSPPNPKSAYWTTFLNQETGVLYGTEKMARIFDYSVVYIEISRKGRGRYVFDFRLITETPKSTKNGEITESHTQLLEQSIRKQPEAWLWSHRRWKHKKPAEK
ncbi:MAG: lysophospholipid acyltransferase family protein [Bacteroidota bacterium]